MRLLPFNMKWNERHTALIVAVATHPLFMPAHWRRRALGALVAWWMRLNRSAMRRGEMVHSHGRRAEDGVAALVALDPWGVCQPSVGPG